MSTDGRFIFVLLKLMAPFQTDFPLFNKTLLFHYFPQTTFSTDQGNTAHLQPVWFITSEMNKKYFISPRSNADTIKDDIDGGCCSDH